MQPTAAIFTSAANACSRVTMPVACARTALPRWLSCLADPSAPTDVRSARGGEFAILADDAWEWALRSLSSGPDDWPDDQESGCG